ncbi:MAG: hypothetical protein JXK93_07230 [Sphaerochaetaceae bacterium]|nr:hypothetical protein [Sphaerochaetaceae bacterium]
MKEGEQERSSQVSLFETLLHSLKEVMDTRADILTLSARRAPFSYRIAYTLETELKALHRSQFTVDMGLSVTGDTKALVPDISVREGDTLLMTLSVRNSYLSERELLALHSLRMSTMCPITLAVALLPRSEYLLIYQSDEMFVDYFHYYTEHHHLSFLKRIETGEIGSSVKQLSLIPSVRKKGL